MTTSELLILALLAEQPRHGYEIERVIEDRGLRQGIRVGFSSIYSILKQLDKARFVEGQMEAPAGKGPARKVFRLTPSGHQALREGTLAALTAPSPPDDAFSLALGNLPGIPNNDALEALRAYRVALSEQIQELRSRRESAQSRLPYHLDASFDRRIQLLEAEFNWVTNFIDLLKTRA